MATTTSRTVATIADTAAVADIDLDDAVEFDLDEEPQAVEDEPLRSAAHLVSVVGEIADVQRRLGCGSWHERARRREQSEQRREPRAPSE